MSRTQQNFDFNDASRQELLRKVRFERGVGCNRGTLQRVLGVIYRFARNSGHCFAGFRRLAAEADVSLSTVRRAIHVLVHKLHLVIEETQRKTRDGFKKNYRWQISWANVDEFVALAEAQQKVEYRQQYLEGDWELTSVSSATSSKPQNTTAEPQKAMGATDTLEPTGEDSQDAEKVVSKYLKKTNCVRSARDRGVPDDQIIEIVRVWLANRSDPANRWEEAALHYRIRSARPNEDPTHHWFKGNRVRPPDLVWAEQQAELRTRMINAAVRDSVPIERLNNALEAKGLSAVTTQELQEPCYG